MWSSAVAIAFALSANGAPGAAKLPKLDYAMRCAGLTEAHAANPALSLEDARIAFDQAVYWGMAASEVARAEKQSSDWFTKEQKRQASEAQAELSRASNPARSELQACQAQVPKLRG